MNQKLNFPDAKGASAGKALTCAKKKFHPGFPLVTVLRTGQGLKVTSTVITPRLIRKRHRPNENKAPNQQQTTVQHSYT